MGSGLVYAAVGLVWAWYAASRVASARAERRADDESSAHGRVIRAATAPDSLDGTGGTSDVTVVPASGTGLLAGAGPVTAPRGATTRVVSRSARRAALRRRRTVLGLLVVASVGIAASTALGYLPIWAAAPAPVLCLGHLVAGARASRRPARSATVPLQAVSATGADDPSWSGVPFVDVVADWCRTVPGEVGGAAGVETRVPGAVDGEVDRFEAARLRSASTPAVEDAGARSWRAVPVPLPTYVTAPRVARIVKTIDLGSTGAWTSGRTAPPPLALPLAPTEPPAGVERVAAAPAGPVTPEGAAGSGSGAVGAGIDAADEHTEALDFPHAATA